MSLARANVATAGVTARFVELERSVLRQRTASFALAAAVHLGVFALASRVPAPPVDLPPRATEIEVMPPPVAPVRDEIPSAPEPPRASETLETPRASSSTPAPSLPVAARAGNVLTARDDAPTTSPGEEPVDFVTDPNGASFGSGTVVRGGTSDRATGADVALRPSRAPVVRGSGTGRGPAEAPTRPEDLARPARLGEPNPCDGFFPRGAVEDVGTVVLSVVVRPRGDVASSEVVSETPSGQGFEEAARSCLAKKTFTPALDKSGAAVAAVARVRIRFAR